ncbi:GYDIA family GHMP kinase [Bacteroidia bacterium]|nr:GYDIA family GHMP kinase [Bacteroidia bacterium]MDB9881751.1 GYDIA family GHMP kinase [Bacteroidia bacterium]
MQTFFSHGKLLITGEYVVLDGALSLAIPTKYGQRMEVEFRESDTNNTLTWYSIDSDGETWYQEEFLIEESHTEHFDPAPYRLHRSVRLNEMELCNINSVSDSLVKILNKSCEGNPWFLEGGSYTVRTYLDFPNNWGLGSSSTLICNIAKWAEVDAFELSEASFGGSGYDIAVGMLGGDILYRSPEMWEGYVYNPAYRGNLYFVHLNQKQNSREGIATYRSKPVNKKVVEQVSDLTENLIKCTDFDGFQQLITEHEALIASVIEMPTVKEKHFSDYPFAIKSLGAWGGDFILACGDKNTPAYFKDKGYDTVLAYSELIK